MHQEAALQRVSSELWRALQPRKPSEGTGVRVRSFVLAGGSGVGKTLLCERLRALMLCEPGQRYAEQSIVWHLGGLTEVGTTQFSGCSAGWDGYGARSFAQLYKEACESASPYVLIQMDELDKAEPEVMDALNSLLDRGYMQLTTKMEQVQPPPETTVLIFFTANYAADSMQRDETLQSAEAVRQAMRKHGLRDCDIGRLGTIVPFPALSTNEMRSIFQKNRDTLLRDHPCGTISNLSEEAHEALMDNVLTHYDARLGVRDAMRQYKRELEDLLDLLQQRLQPNTIVHSTECRRLPFDSPLLSEAAQIYFGNKERLRLYDKCTHGTVHCVLTLCRGQTSERPLSIFVLAPTLEKSDSDRKRAKK
jgi:ATP-dependent Clp protease ATP-binding subunit ClpA